MRAWLFLLLFGVLPVQAGAVHTAVPEKPDPASTYVIYLHGRIVENAGPRPRDPRFGVYDYPAVLDALSSRGAVVISVQRPPQTEVNAFAGAVVSQIESLVAQGVPPGNIVVIGFSKGGAIAVRTSSFLRRPEVRYVLLAACPAEPMAPNLRLTGRVLSVYEASDTLAASCNRLASMPERPESFEEIQVSTGKSHGAFYLPHRAWLEPVLSWVHRGGS